MSRTKTASHYYNLGRQQAARDILGGRTKTAAPSAKDLRQLAALGGAGLLGAGMANSKVIGGGIGGGIDAAISRAAMTGRALMDPNVYRMAMIDAGERAAMTGEALTDPAVYRMALQDLTGASSSRGFRESIPNLQLSIKNKVPTFNEGKIPYNFTPIEDAVPFTPEEESAAALWDLVNGYLKK